MVFGAIDLWRIAGEQVVEGWHVEDFVGVLLAWGALPVAWPARGAPAAAPAPDAAAEAAGPAADPRDVIHAWYRALHRADLAALADLLDPRFLNHDPLGPALSVSGGREDARRDLTALQRAFPDLDVIVADVFAEGERVVARVVLRGTHLEALAGLAPTRRRMAVMGNEL
jgi:predicted ester cyclase